MKAIFEPGDGSSEIILEKGEPILPEHNVLGTAVLRKLGKRLFAVEKEYNQILDEDYIG